MNTTFRITGASQQKPTDQLQELFGLQTNQARDNFRRARRKALSRMEAGLLALSVMVFASHAASPPAATLLYTTTNNAPIVGGMATIGSSGVSYFSTLSTASTKANVTALNSSGSQPKWKF